jgi:hypothetical protein
MTYAYRHGDGLMANDEHVAILKKGVDAWNAWRDNNRHIRPDLSDANLSKPFLSGARLSEADLSGANLNTAKSCRSARAFRHFSTDENVARSRWQRLIALMRY